MLCNSCQRSWHWAWTCYCTIGLCCRQCGCQFVYAKCKLLFTTLTHLQSNSRSVVVCELASFYGSLVKKKKKNIWGVSVLHTWLLSYVWITCIPWKRCSASVSSTHSNYMRHTVCYTTGRPSDVRAVWFELHTDAFVTYFQCGWNVARLSSVGHWSTLLTSS